LGVPGEEGGAFIACLIGVGALAFRFAWGEICALVFIAAFERFSRLAVVLVRRLIRLAMNSL